MIHTIFFGTNLVAKTVLQALINAPNISVDLVITQPDKPVGRKQIMTPTAVAELASQHNIPVEKPETLKDFPITKLPSCQVAILADYGLIIPQTIIDAFPKGILNVHPSLLPEYRGATPVPSAILHGETTTGVTIMQVEKRMDAGPILATQKYELAPDEMAQDALLALAKIGANVLVEKLPAYMADEIALQVQDDTEATFCNQFTREDGRIDWGKTTQEIYNQYRALSPWPGLWTTWDTKRVKLLKIRPATNKQGNNGQVSIEGDTMYIGTAGGSIQILELQLEGKNAMDVKTFVKGFRQIDGEQFS
ncbi:MAG: Methionyl-tRNA formyltransferase [Candidatus Magasanikbacteria bacterium GW2011_GWD2_43_18]|uniref:Methionyl-tRNA formyltransferase n=1 Tax=Candidatus Magasanikbacteria bacterium GW2011_GWE2_42_7 TaxID=1619052 RepID=A0A0G1BGF6_9BACT|nr:MAG: Methionyl-tRNA formyltransferase [Candidatus Magasanikbacteria bacterium GW2011_GWC2_42_27]KKS72495.1 MAG: Methionyl-tRNA formyltransferase [Candidatus Magasanikbacteria bacterium GW2011_GWE2_42_7]KKT03395.1 MAG: Methionyl-tRNA formyltransferase [Candidatus Magasanikbacteria bacterium GW2011_GWD2_43_18]KKT25275.1 MAG: Methionyl-tRNA formyltransferase [Candidatus Magasanikbacteria bacterium GW2011_GWA2_43_9]